jgi:putative transposase
MGIVSQLSFDQKDLYERWINVKEDFWGDLKKETLLALQRLLETTMNVEIQDLAGARRWIRCTSRRAWRNGFYSRTLLTSFGWINRLRVPRLRSGNKPFSVLRRYQRRCQDVDALVLRLFLAGVATRRVKEVLKPLLGDQSLSASVVSRISKQLDSHVQQFHNRPLHDHYRYLFLDGIYLKAKSPIKSKRRCVLVAYGIRHDGIRELIDFRLANHGESQIAWEVFLAQIQQRGLSGQGLDLICVDGNKGLWNAIDLAFPSIPKQRCWAHKLRNALQHLPLKDRDLCKIQARNIYNASSFHQAVLSYKAWAHTWRLRAPQTVHTIEKDLDSLLQFYRCPQNLWLKLRTTNAIERCFLEVRRRTRPMTCFQNVQSVERIIFAIFSRMNGLWMDKPLWKTTHNY